MKRVSEDEARKVLRAALAAPDKPVAVSAPAVTGTRRGFKSQLGDILAIILTPFVLLASWLVWAAGVVLLNIVLFGTLAVVVYALGFLLRSFV